jgi:hypothetical protein
MSAHNGTVNGTNGTASRNGESVNPASKTVADVEKPAAPRGRPFQPGNKFGKGNPFYRQLAAIRQAAVDVVGIEGVKELMKDLHRRALAGDVMAARVVLYYTVGKPLAAVDPDACDQDEWQRLQQLPRKSQIWASLLDSLTAEQAIDLVRHILETRLEQGSKALGDPEGESIQAERAARVGK